jgi:hypothetical protein
MPDPTPSPGVRSPCRASRQDHAVLAWLVVEAGRPNTVHLHLLDALLAWTPLMGEHLFPTEPEAGVEDSGGRLCERATRSMHDGREAPAFTRAPESSPGHAGGRRC